MEVNSTIISAYDLPVYGVGTWKFRALHFTAFICLTISLMSATLVIIHVARKNKIANFFKWSIADRIVTYMAFCDAMFSLSVFPDQITIV